MAEFLGDIAGMLELFAIATGLVLLHQANKAAPAKLLKLAGWVLVIGGLFVGTCTTYYWLKYQARGDFDSAHMTHTGMMQGPSKRGSGSPATQHSNHDQ